MDINMEPLNMESLIEEGKNKQTIFCLTCPSKILCKGVGHYKEIQLLSNGKWKVILKQSWVLPYNWLDAICSGSFTNNMYMLPNIRPKKDRSEDEKDEEELKEYWQVDNMYHFENIGYSNTIDGRKYLICADCEMGPIGWQDLETKASYLAARRVKYSD